jgi:transposase-like protein
VWEIEIEFTIYYQEVPLPAASELLDVLRTGQAVDLIRESVRMVLQELIEAEATDMVGAARYERADTRANERNESRPGTHPRGGPV